MPNRIAATRDAIDRRAERLIIAELLLEIVYNPDPHPMTYDVREKVIGHAVTIGTIKGRPLNLSQIALLVGMDRATTRRHLAEMVRLGGIEKHGRYYLVSLSAAERVAGRLDHWVQSILRAADLLRTVHNERYANGQTISDG